MLSITLSTASSRYKRSVPSETSAIVVTHSLLNAFGIKNVISKSIQISNAEIQYSQPITFVFLSDNEIDLDQASLAAKRNVVESSL
ncbi:DUF6046 domain-containing protein [Leptospira santarosai]|nr:DUF6046 domain-containing protein [Leptospira santarosai]MDI7226355.1 DUF6046 domain-containing protein [Leptospira santarosai]